MISVFKHSMEVVPFLVSEYYRKIITFQLRKNGGFIYIVVLLRSLDLSITVSFLVRFAMQQTLAT